MASPQFCPSCKTRLMLGRCRRCDGTFERAKAEAKPHAGGPPQGGAQSGPPGPGTGRRRGGATFSGQRGRYQRPTQAGPGPIAGDQRRLGGVAAAPRGDEPLVDRSSSRYELKVGGKAHGELPLFPFDDIRDGQRAFARDVMRQVSRGGYLVAHAPTGIGKTAAAIAPALQQALDEGKKVLFLTSKQSQHHIVVDTLRAVVERRAGRFAAVDVISKRDMCPRPEKDEVPGFAFNEMCTRLCRTKKCSFFTNDAEGAISEATAGIHHVEELVDISLSHECCPHKVAMGAAKQSDVIVCDYNYLFSDLRERILESFEVGLDDLVVVIDEAHNLASRVRSNFSLELTPFSLDEARAEARREKDLRAERWCVALGDVLGRLAAGLEENDETVLSKRELMDAVEERVGQGSITGEPQTFIEFVSGLSDVADARTKAGEDLARSGQVAEFLEAWSHGGAAYGRILRKDAGGQWRLQHKLLDPGVVTGPILADVHAAILMSGTCHPPEMYRDILGLPERNTRTKVYPSPYDPANKPVLCVRGVTSRYKDRTPQMYERFGRIAVGLHEACGGNSAVFCISYDFVNRIREEVERYGNGIELIVEDRGMGKAERDQVLDTLQGAQKRGGAMLIGVLGGSLSEGVDYKGNLLRAVSVVGLPLAPPGREVDLLIENFERKFTGRGKDYAYVFPAMERVLQAAGRGVRGAEDRCPVVLLDERFAWRMYNRAFPADFQMRVVDDPVSELRGFFQATHAARRSVLV